MALLYLYFPTVVSLQRVTDLFILFRLFISIFPTVLSLIGCTVVFVPHHILYQWLIQDFPWGGGGGVHPLGGRGPPMWALFGENICENERIGSHRGWRAPGTPPRSANVYDSYLFLLCLLQIINSLGIGCSCCFPLIWTWKLFLSLLFVTESISNNYQSLPVTVNP